MGKIINVKVGEIRFSKSVLVSKGIGSCIVIAAYHPEKRIGALTHIMHSGRAPDHVRINKTKYAANAIDKLIGDMIGLGVNKKDILACVVGGAEVLKEKDGSLPKNNINSTIALLEKNKINICAKAVGGTEARSVYFDVENGKVFYTIGDGPQKLLWSSNEQDSNKQESFV